MFKYSLIGKYRQFNLQNLRSVFGYDATLFQADPFHTVFGLAGLSLLGDSSLSSVDAVLCMTKRSLSTLAIC